MDKFIAYQKVIGRCDKVNGCIEWTGAKNDSGYGVQKVGQKFWYVHRFVRTIEKGNIPQGLTIDHMCKNILCCNVDHLRLVTSEENAKQGRETHIKNNTKLVCEKHGPRYRMPSGRLHCKVCDKIRITKWAVKKFGSYAAYKREIRRRKKERDTVGEK